MKNQNCLIPLLLLLSSFIASPIFSQTDFEFILSESEEVVISNSNPWGLMHIPDGPISFKNFGNEIRM